MTRNHVLSYTLDNLAVLPRRKFYITLKETAEDVVAKGVNTSAVQYIGTCTMTQSARGSIINPVAVS